MTSTTSGWTRAIARPSLDPRVLGGALCVAGLALLVVGSVIASALGIELLAAAFWCWARASVDANAQLKRWAWLRRPASALWLAAAVHLVAPSLTQPALLPRHGVFAALELLQAAAVLWAGLDLLAALPLARPYSDLPGPLLSVRLWLPVMLPAAGFMVLWRLASHWSQVDGVRRVAVPLLLFTAVLGVLRAFARRTWTASLRWLVISDSALAALLIARPIVSGPATFLLWLAACGGHAFLLAAETRGSTARRGPLITRQWRAASWTTLACLSWPALLAAGSDDRRSIEPIYFAAAAIASGLAAWITVSRMVAAPERRQMTRPNTAMVLSHIGAALFFIAGPLALVIAWWGEFEPGWRPSIGALMPVVLGGLGAVVARGQRGAFVRGMIERAGTIGPVIAGRVFRMVIRLEQAALELLGKLISGVTSPLHDLHTGDAQEYLLFLVGIGVLALVIPLLQ